MCHSVEYPPTHAHTHTQERHLSSINWNRASRLLITSRRSAFIDFTRPNVKASMMRGAVYAEEEEEGSYLTNARFVQIHLPSNTVGKQFLSRHDATSSDYAQQKQMRMRSNMKTKQKFSFRREKFCLNHLDQKQVSGMSKNHAKNERENDSKKRDSTSASNCDCSEKFETGKGNVVIAGRRSLATVCALRQPTNMMLFME